MSTAVIVNSEAERAGARGSGGEEGGGVRTVAVAGSPNVGKSTLFHRLTGIYATVSNYPGTTVEVTRGRGAVGEETFNFIDTPGMYSLLCVTEEERTARTIIFEEHLDIIVHVVSARDLERMLALTLQLVETGIPVVLVLNMIDEAEREGVTFDLPTLAAELGVPVVAAASTTGRGFDELGRILQQTGRDGRRPLAYDEPLESIVQEAQSLVPGPLLRRARASLVLQGDPAFAPEGSLRSLVESAQRRFSHPLAYELAVQRQRISSRLTMKAARFPRGRERGAGELLSSLMINPWTGIPILLLILYFGLYRFVGGFGAGILVNVLEKTVFEEHVNPWVTAAATAIIPWEILQRLLVGEYGVITLGVRYAAAIILPIVATFFLVFSLLEDTGYLPRLSLLIDRLFKSIGLSGRAVIPMVLGVGCATMATLVTRTLPTARERIIATLLLTLAIPCSAQLGVILSLLDGNAPALLIWLGVLSLAFLLIGVLSNSVLGGTGPRFHMEIPPLRIPRISNIAVKTWSRMVWYFKEILPMFMLASVLIWVGQLTGLFDILVSALTWVVRLIGLPDRAAVSFLFGFFRRDYGAAGLFDMKSAGLLTGHQLVVAAVTLTLFVPCVAQFLVNVRERGMRVGIGLSLFVLGFSFGAGFLVHQALIILGVKL